MAGPMDEGRHIVARERGQGDDDVRSSTPRLDEDSGSTRTGTFPTRKADRVRDSRQGRDRNVQSRLTRGLAYVPSAPPGRGTPLEEGNEPAASSLRRGPDRPRTLEVRNGSTTERPPDPRPEERETSGWKPSRLRASIDGSRARERVSPGTRGCRKDPSTGISRAAASRRARISPSRWNTP